MSPVKLAIGGVLAVSAVAIPVVLGVGAALPEALCGLNDEVLATITKQECEAAGFGGDQCGTGIVSGNVPDSLTATTANGETVTLDRAELTHAETIAAIGSQTEGVGQDGIIIALMAALTESKLRMLANTTAYPESANYPNDGDGSDHNSLGLFQMRPTGWGTVEELMDPTYQARTFYGGPDGPNGGSPRGLLDIPDWERLSFGEAAQAVEVSAYPDRYANYEPVARAILSALTGSSASSSEVVWPGPEETITSRFGWRDLNGEVKFHEGLDFGQDLGAPILAAADGTVMSAGPAGTYGNLIKLEHTIGGETLQTWYAHMAGDGVLVRPGEVVQAGDEIGRVGNEGYSFGAHLHFEVHRNGAAVDPEEWLRTQGAGTGQSGEPAGCIGDVTPPEKNEDGTWPDEVCAVKPDPTQPTWADSCVTLRTATMIAMLREWGIDQPWGDHKSLSCYRYGGDGEHPLGRACDAIFGTLNTCPSSAHKADGDALAQFLADNYDTWAVQYVIWDGRIWNSDRDQPGLPLAQWRPYNGASGCQNGDYAREMHYDHVHISVR